MGGEPSVVTDFVEALAAVARCCVVDGTLLQHQLLSSLSTAFLKAFQCGATQINSIHFIPFAFQNIWELHELVGKKHFRLDLVSQKHT